MSDASSGKGDGVGVAALFARAVAAHHERRGEGDAAEVRGGVEVMTCARCGAPRQREALNCRFCGGAL